MNLSLPFRDALIRWFGVVVLFLVPVTILFSWHFPATVKQPAWPPWDLKVPAPPPETPSALAEVWRTGVLEVATRYGPTSYYQGADGPTGFEHDLVEAFAAHLGVRPRFVVPDSLGGVLEAVTEGEADLAAAGLTITDARRERLRFTDPYQAISVQLVHARDTPAPDRLTDTCGDYIHVLANSSHLELIEERAREDFCLLPQAHCNLNMEELLEGVRDGRYTYALVDSNEMAVVQHFYPQLRVALELHTDRHLAWAFPRSGDDSLFQAAQSFIDEAHRSGLLNRLQERYYGHLEEFDYVGTREFIRDIGELLPRYEDWFRTAADRTGLDWRLLAAIGYQESHWEADAVSPTGVRGIMMLTQDTARQMEVDNRTDPRQSILGGARYLLRVRDKLPERIPEPDRTWMALAAYNVGFGHLEDARKLTEGQGGDPDRWPDVREHLPLLAKKRWYRHTDHGFARGWEPVNYVENIRIYYDILVWFSEKARRREWLAEHGQLATGGPTASERATGERPESALEALRKLLPASL